MKVKTTHFRYISWFLLLIALATLVYAVTNGTINHHLLFNSDALYLPWLYHSLFVNKYSFSSISYPGAPYFFPDFTIFTPIRMISGSFVVANVLTPIIIFTGIVVGFVVLFDLIVDYSDKVTKALFISIVSTYILLISQGLLLESTIMFISPVWHEGSILVSLMLIILFFLSMKVENKVIDACVLLLMSLTSFSDKTILKDLAAPLLCSSALLILLDLKYIKKLYKYLLCLFLGMITGSILYKNIIPDAHSFSEPKLWYKFNLANLGKSLKYIFTQKELAINVATIEYYFPNHLRFTLPFILITIIIAGIVSVLGIRGILLSKKRHINIRLIIISSFIFFQFIFNTIAVVFFGYFESLTHLRYFGAIFLFPVFYFFYLVSITIDRYKTRYKYYVFVINTFIFLILSTRTIFISNEGGFLNIFRYKPPNVDCVDSMLTDSNFTYGLSDYWNSSTITFFSSKGAQLRHIATPGGKYIQAHLPLNSTESYIGNKYNYVLTERLDERLIKKELGEPNQIIECPTTSVFIYNDEEVTNHINYKFSAIFFNEILRNSNNSYTIKASDFSNLISKPYHVTQNQIENELTPERYLKPEQTGEAGVFNFSPIVYLEKGSYLIDLTYSADGKNVGVYNLMSPSQNKLVKLYFRDTNGAFETQRTPIDAYGDLALFTYYSGSGDLFVKEITITKED